MATILPRPVGESSGARAPRVIHGRMLGTASHSSKRSPVILIRLPPLWSAAHRGTPERPRSTSAPRRAAKLPFSTPTAERSSPASRWASARVASSCRVTARRSTWPCRARRAAAQGVDESKLPPADRSADGVGVVDLATRKLVRTLPSGVGIPSRSICQGRQDPLRLERRDRRDDGARPREREGQRLGQSGRRAGRCDGPPRRQGRSTSPASKGTR